MNKAAIPLILFLLSGIFFLGKGTTGFVVSESCCHGEGCNQENICEPSKPSNFNRDIFYGGLLMAISVAIYLAMQNLEPSLS